MCKRVNHGKESHQISSAALKTPGALGTSRCDAAIRLAADITRRLTSSLQQTSALTRCTVHGHDCGRAASPPEPVNTCRARQTLLIEMVGGISCRAARRALPCYESPTIWPQLRHILKRHNIEAKLTIQQCTPAQLRLKYLTSGRLLHRCTETTASLH